MISKHFYKNRGNIFDIVSFYFVPAISKVFVHIFIFDVFYKVS